MSLYNKIINRQEKISVIGLGYVGMPLAIAFARKAEVIGYDIEKIKIDAYKKGIDVTNEVGSKALFESAINWTYDEKCLRNAKFHIVAVPTPINQDKTPNLKPVIEASRTVGRNLTKGSIVVFESTVYPGVTEDICIPILEEVSNLKCGIDFKVGYSPERVSPGDKINRLETIVKVVSGIDNESLEDIARIYEMIIEAGVHRAESIKVAEAAKVIENSQRDINIAFMNELSMVFNKMEIDTKAVLEAAGTKWNFLKFTPGLVGGHCIGVDPYYFVYKAEDLGYHSQIISSGRRINDGMGKYVAENSIKKLIKSGKKIKGANIAILGITFKENCPDSRNTKVMDIINELLDYEVNIKVVDPVADKDEVRKHYNIELYNYESISNVDAIIIAVPHKEFYDIDLSKLKSLYVDKDNPVLIDVKGIFDKKEVECLNYTYWRL